MINQFFLELGKLSASTLAVVTAFAGLFGVIITAVVGIIVALIGKFIVGARDKQDKEVEWRKHAIELTKLDLERKLKTRSPDDTTPLRPSILDFLANYRDLQELGKKSPADLYKVIKEKRIAQPRTVAAKIPSADTNDPKAPRVA
jgi:hypothetical protein